MTNQTLAKLAYDAILIEVNSWPSLGLVSKNNSGCHKDMNIETFKASAQVFQQYFTELNDNFHNITTFAQLRNIGLKHEQRMFSATNNINTHKGLIFALGIYYYFALQSNAYNWDYEDWPAKIKDFVKPLKSELQTHSHHPTNGETIYWLYKIGGAKLSALKGYKVVNKGVKFLKKIKAKQSNLSKENLSFILLLFYFKKINDTNIIAKIGIKKYRQWKRLLKTLLRKITKKYHNHIGEIMITNHKAIIEQVSPGGCADLVVLTWFIDNCHQAISKNS